jgi:hypothetical protein
MDRFDRPNKEQIRDWMQRRWQERNPLPDPEQLRLQLRQHSLNADQEARRAAPDLRRYFM